jgi:hypothetical protein
MLQSSAGERAIERTTHIHRQVILMPRYGVKNVVVRERPVTLPRVRFLETPLPEEPQARRAH